MKPTPILQRLEEIELFMEDINAGLIRVALGAGQINNKVLKPRSVLATTIDVTNLAAIKTKTGALTVDGTLTVGAAIVLSTDGVFYSSGKSSYADTDAGFWLGYDSGSGTYRVNFGNATDFLKWDGTTLTVTGSITATSIKSGKTDYGDNTNAGYFVGVSGGLAKVDIGAATTIALGGARMQWDGTALAIGGTFRFGSAGQHLLDGTGVHFITDGSVAVIDTKHSATPTYSGSINGVSGATSGGWAINGILTAGGGSQAAVSVSGSTSDAATIVSTLLYKTTGVFGAGYDVVASGAHTWYVDNGVTAMVLVRTGPEIKLYGKLTLGLSGTVSTTGNYLSDNNDSLLVTLGDAAGARHFVIADSGGNAQFTINSDGLLKTNQATAASALGAIAKVIPIYSIAGTLQGYMPLYASFTP